MFQTWCSRRLGDWLSGFHYPFLFFDPRENCVLAPLPPVNQWTDILLKRNFDICPVHNDTRLHRVSTSGYRLDHFRIHWDRLLERSNFIAPLISFDERPIIELFLKRLVHRGILEEVNNPCQMVLHVFMVIPKNEKGKVAISHGFPGFEQAL